MWIEDLRLRHLDSEWGASDLKSTIKNLQSKISMDYLLKTEPSEYSFADLQKDKTTIWDDDTKPDIGEAEPCGR